MPSASLRRGALTLTAASMFDFALQLLLPVALVRLLPAAAFADYRLAWLAIGTAMAVAPLALPRSLFYFLPRAPAAEQAAYARNTVLLLLLSGALAGALLGPWNALLPDSLRRIDGGAWFLPSFLTMWVAASLAEFLPSARGAAGLQAGLIAALACLRVAVVALAALSGRADIVFAALLGYAAFKLALVAAYVWRHYGAAAAAPASAATAAATHYAPTDAAATGPATNATYATATTDATDATTGATTGAMAATAAGAAATNAACAAAAANAACSSPTTNAACSYPTTNAAAATATAIDARDANVTAAATAATDATATDANAAGPQVRLLRTQLAYALPFGLASALFLLRGQADQWVAAAMFPAAAFAAFSIGAVIMPVVALLRTSVANAISARLSALESQRDRGAMLRLNQRANLAVGFVLLPALALTAVLAEHIVAVIYTPAFLAAAAVMRINCLALLGVAVEVSTLTMALSQGRFLLAADAALLPLGVAAGVAGALLWGLPGAALGNTLTLAAGNAFSFWRVARVTAVPVRRLQRWDALLRILVCALAAAIPALLLDRAGLVRAPLPEALLIGAVFAPAYLLMLKLAGLMPELRELFGPRPPAVLHPAGER